MVETHTLDLKSNGNGNGHHETNSLNSTNSNWEDPVIPSGMDTPDIPADLLPGWLGGYVDAVSRNTKTPPGMSVLMSLSVIATCIQKRFEVSPYGDDYREPLALWTATALPPGSRKTAVVSALTNPLSDWEVEEQEDQGHRASGETDCPTAEGAVAQPDHR